jgi:hypothetical protein
MDSALPQPTQSASFPLFFGVWLLVIATGCLLVSSCNSGTQKNANVTSFDPDVFLGIVKVGAEAKRQVSGIEERNTTFVVETFLSNRDQFAVELCSAATSYAFDMRPTNSKEVLIESVSGNELIRVTASNRDCGKPEKLTAVYDNSAYRASIKPAKVKIGMSYEAVASSCGRGRDLNSHESPNEKIVWVTYAYNEKTADRGCFGRFMFRDWTLVSIDQ